MKINEDIKIGSSGSTLKDSAFSKEYLGGQTANANELTQNGFYVLDINTTYYNFPDEAIGQMGFLLVFSDGNNVIQFVSVYGSYLGYRTCCWGTWYDWKKISLI